MFSLFEWQKSQLVFVGCVLAAILVVSQIQLRVGQMKTRDAQRKADAEIVGRALDRYYQDHEAYPAASQGLIVACGDLVDVACNWGGDGIRDAEGVVYLKALPTDPLASQGRKYVYTLDSTGKKYRVNVALEYRQDVDWKTNLTTKCGESIQCNWYVGN